MARPQVLLVELADARLRHFLDGGPALGNPPAGDPLGKELLELPDRLVGHGHARLQHHAGERALVPARVGDADDRRLDHLRVGHELVLELDGGNPFPARLDDVLRPVGDLDEATGVDRAHVAGAEPAPVELPGRVVPVIGRRYPRTAHLDLAGRLPVPGAHAPGLRAPAPRRDGPVPPARRPALSPARPPPLPAPPGGAPPAAAGGGRRGVAPGPPPRPPRPPPVAPPPPRGGAPGAPRPRRRRRAGA